MIGGLTGTVKNLSLEFAVETITLQAALGKNVYRGLLCNTNTGTIENCYFSGTIKKISMKYYYSSSTYCYFGSVCGSNSGTIQNCANAVNISSMTSDDSRNFFGGICAYDSGSISRCRNTASWKSESGSRFTVGGICGKISAGTISECSNEGDSDFSASSYSSVGGICGEAGNDTTISACKNTGNLSGTDCGGIVVNGSPTITSVYNTGNINGYFEAMGIGLGTVTNAYNTGVVKGSSIKAIGGSNVSNCYYINTSNAAGSGTMKSEKNMKTEEFAELLGDDFIYVEGDFPHLKWESLEPTSTEIVSTFDKTELSLTECGQKETLTLTTNDKGSVTYISTDTNVAIVDENGTVTAVGDGTAIIYAICSNSRAECTVTVKSAHALSETALSVEKGESKVLSVISTKTGEKDADLQVTFASSDESIATVNKNGRVSGVAEGTCEVTATFGETSLICQVTVTPKTEEPTSPVTSEPALDRTSLTLHTQYQFTLHVNNSTGAVSWVSSDTKIATVSADGTVKGIKEGSAVIYAMLSSGKTLTCNVTVKDDFVFGDVNEDDTFTVADVILLQKWISNVPNTKLPNWKAVDLNGDNIINIIDLALMKQSLLNR